MSCRSTQRRTRPSVAARWCMSKCERRPLHREAWRRTIGDPGASESHMPDTEVRRGEPGFDDRHSSGSGRTGEVPKVRTSSASSRTWPMAEKRQVMTSNRPGRRNVCMRHRTSRASGSSRRAMASNRGLVSKPVARNHRERCTRWPPVPYPTSSRVRAGWDRTGERAVGPVAPPGRSPWKRRGGPTRRPRARNPRGEGRAAWHRSRRTLRSDRTLSRGVARRAGPVHSLPILAAQRARFRKRGGIG